MLPVCPAMFSMTMVSNFRDQFLRGLYESSEVSTKNSEVHVRVIQDKCTLFLRQLSHLLIDSVYSSFGDLEIKNQEKST